MYHQALLFGLFLLILITIVEVWKPHLFVESFTSLITMGDSPAWARWMPRRGDIGPDPTKEHDGYLRDTRYFANYTDVQRLGQNHDFCRVVQSITDPDDKFFACALGGTDGFSTIKYRTPSVKEGLELSRDDYMGTVGGRKGYCRILKTPQGTFEARCNLADATTFRPSLVMDSDPNPDIKRLLTFYEGIQMWLRMRDDLLDYAKVLTVMTAGSLKMDEMDPNPPITRGLSFNGKDQYLRIGDTHELAFGDQIQLRSMRAVCFWVYFEEFTNNAHLFDFGVPGQPSVWCGILGRGNPGKQQETMNHDPVCQSVNTVPQAPSGAQCTEEVCPQVAMATSAANVNRWDCPVPELFGAILPPLQPKSAPPGEATTADLIYEIWDKRDRKLHLQIKNVIPLRKWVHIAITTNSMDPMRPGILVFKNGEQVYKEEAAWLPQDAYPTHNYIGKSNYDDSDTTGNRDELFKGSLFDFRTYKTMMTEQKIKQTVQWGKDLLGLHQNQWYDQDE